MKHPIKMGWLGGTSIFGNTHMENTSSETVRLVGLQRFGSDMKILIWPVISDELIYSATK